MTARRSRLPSARAALFSFAVLFVFPLLAGCLSFHTGPLPGEPPKARFANIEQDGARVRVRFVDTGEKDDPRPVAVLVHGFAASLGSWATVMPELGKTHRILALDLKGFGFTDRPEGDYSPDAQARLVLGLMQERGVERAAIVAHSWGSSVTLALALRAPERITKIALYDAWVYEDQIPTFFHWSRAPGVGEALFGVWYKERAEDRIVLAFYDKTKVTEPLVEEIDAALDRPGTVAAALAAVRGQRFAEVEDRYRTVQKPVLLLWGREDRVTTLRYGERLAKELPNARLVVYPQCGHFPMLEAVAASNRDLVAFLNAPEGAAP